MIGNRDDPRSEAEKARADLKRNAEIGNAVTETPLTRQPSVTPGTFGEHWEKARSLSGSDQGVEAGGAAPGTGRHGRPGMARGTGRSESLADGEQAVTGRDHTEPTSRRGDEDALTRARE